MKNFLLYVGMIVCLAIVNQAQADTTREAFAKSYQYERTQSYSEAIRALVSVREKSYLLDLRLGWLYYLSGNHANARQHYQNAIQASPKAIEPRLGLTLPLIAQSRFEELETQSRTILMMDPNHYTASLRLSYALRMQKKYAQARDVNKTLLDLYPTDVSFLAEQLLISMAMNNNDAKTLAETILTLDPENVTAKQHLAVTTPPRQP